MALLHDDTNKDDKKEENNNTLVWQADNCASIVRVKKVINLQKMDLPRNAEKVARDGQE